jgi:hypothetical protein
VYLCEEYMLRHAIHIPYVRHVNSGCVFYKEGEVTWRLLTINWTAPSWHPGAYYVRKYIPLHDGYAESKLFHLIDESKVCLDEYEDYFLAWRKNVTQIASGPMSKLAAWEVCLCCYDSLLTNYIAMPDFQLILDQDVPGDQRLSALERVIGYFQKNFTFFAEAWQTEIYRYLDGYAYWLADLANEK